MTYKTVVVKKVCNFRQQIIIFQFSYQIYTQKRQECSIPTCKLVEITFLRHLLVDYSAGCSNVVNWFLNGTCGAIISTQTFYTVTLMNDLNFVRFASEFWLLSWRLFTASLPGITLSFLNIILNDPL